MNSNLKATLIKYGIQIKDFAKAINVTESTASLKANGKAIVTTEEAFVIQNMIYEKTNIKVSIEEIFNRA